jgi:hypothetical protein
LRILNGTARGLVVPRFHFNICHAWAGTIDRDDEGMVLPDVAAAESEALESATELVIEKIKTGQRIDSRFEVTDAEGNLVFVLPFREAVRF